MYMYMSLVILQILTARIFGWCCEKATEVTLNEEKNILSGCYGY